MKSFRLHPTSQQLKHGGAKWRHDRGPTATESLRAGFRLSGFGLLLAVGTMFLLAGATTLTQVFSAGYVNALGVALLRGFLLLLIGWTIMIAGIAGPFHYIISRANT
ncbi:MAG: hypothetical protein ABEK12_02380 [Candidatus Nanohaloarchaea archaeon]